MTLISIQFFALALIAILCSILFTGPLRAVLFFLVNIAFVFSYLTPVGMASTLLFCAAGYSFIRLAMAGKKWALPVGSAVLIVAFVFMRNYAFLHVLLPGWMLTNVLATVGLSFLLFKILHILIDASGGFLEDCDPLLFANYALNFTTFLIGPLQRFESFRDQWNGVETTLPRNFSEQLGAVNRILRGLVKKFVLAELLAPYIVNSPTVDFHSVSAAAILLKAYAYYAYLYCDFSGYCDIVIGVGTLMGVRPPENFNLPFLARNTADFWLRFHRSLTMWLTDYVFTPLYASGLRRWSARSAALPIMLVALMVTMVVSGLWHGTTLAFLIFGIMHGTYMVIYRLYDNGLKAMFPAKRVAALTQNPAMTVAAVVVTFHAVAIAGLCFILTGKQLGQVASKLIHLL